MIDRFRDQPVPPGHELLSLHRLRRGRPARVVRLEGRPEHVHRLLEFGFRPGCCFQLERCGNPCIIRTNGTRFCLRTGRELDVLVEPLDHAPRESQPGAQADRSAAHDAGPSGPCGCEG